MKKLKFAIILDSSSGYSFKLIQQNYPNIFVFPLTLIINNEAFNDTDENFSYEKMLDLLNNDVMPKTAQPNGIVFQKYIDNLFKEYEKIYVLPISSLLSGAFDSMKLISEKAQYKNKLFVLDTKLIFLATTHLISYIYDDFLNDVNIEIIQNKIASLRNNFYYLFVPRNINFLVNSGRVNLAKEFLINLFKLKLIIKWDTKANLLNKARSNQAVLEILSKDINETLNEYPDSKVTVLMSDENKNFESITEYFNSLNTKNISFHKSIPNIILAHIGPVSYGIFIEKIKNG